MALHVLLGCGYTGSRVARLWDERGDRITVVTRSADRARQFRRQGWNALIGDVCDASSLDLLGTDDETIDSLVYAVGYDRSQGIPIGQVYANGLENVLASLANRRVRRVIYLSTTGVYGDSGGAWIDEDTPPSPTRPGGVASLAAEEVLRGSSFAEVGTILRLAGLYGPGRLPYLVALRQGEPLEASPQGYLNLIHVEDAARVVETLSLQGRESPGPEVFCVSDGSPVQRSEFYNELSRQMHTPPPRFVDSPAGSRVGRAGTNKRISNRRLMENLQIKFQYPTYREGIANIVAQTDIP